MNNFTVWLPYGGCFNLKVDKNKLKNSYYLGHSKTGLPRKSEIEAAFVLKKDLTGSNVTNADVLEATEYVLVAIEIVASRVQDWKIKLHDTIGDNAS